MTVCAEGIRERHIYTSDSNRVELRIVTKSTEKQKAYFIIEYRGKKNMLALFRKLLLIFKTA